MDVDSDSHNGVAGESSRPSVDDKNPCLPVGAQTSVVSDFNLDFIVAQQRMLVLVLLSAYCCYC